MVSFAGILSLAMLAGCGNSSPTDSPSSTDPVTNGDPISNGETGDADSGSGVNGDAPAPDFGAMVYVPAGSFQRDANPNNISEITQGFLMSQYPVTQQQFEAIMGVNPSQFNTGGDAANRPVEYVSWYHAIAYANKLSIAAGLTPAYNVSGVDFHALTYDDVPLSASNAWSRVTVDWAADGYRLPTEMERLWAAMGATSGHDYPGDGVYTTGYDRAFAGSTGANDAADYAWHNHPGGTGTAPVGSKRPNELGIHDMSGNVNEWVWDRTRTSANYPGGTLTDYRGSDDTSVLQRVTRGGGWGNGPNSLRIAGEFGLGFGGRSPWQQSNSFGFRLVRNANE